MTTKGAFNAEEWETVTQGPLLAGMRVVAAERGGTLRETVAIGKVYRDAREHHGESELLDELVASPPGLDANKLKDKEISSYSAERLREGLRLVTEKATADEVESYRWFVRAVAEAAATAHKEGGFLGIGGKPVSEAEQKALDEISAALGA